MMNSSLGNIQFNNTQGNITAMLSNSSFNDQNYISGANDSSFSNTQNLNNTQPLNLSSNHQLYAGNGHQKKQSLGGAAAEL
jgi:hypothetical protein